MKLSNKPKSENEANPKFEFLGRLRLPLPSDGEAFHGLSPSGPPEAAIGYSITPSMEQQQLTTT